MRPAPMAYVKVYVRSKEGKIGFYKDGELRRRRPSKTWLTRYYDDYLNSPLENATGYTDVRGCFDFLSLNTNQISNAKDFSIFVSHPDFGSLVKRTVAPAMF